MIDFLSSFLLLNAPGGAPPPPTWWWLTMAAVCLLAGAGVTFVLMYRKLHVQLGMQRVSIEKDMAAKAKEEKRRFFNNVSNELRGPLALVINPLQAMVVEPMREDQRQRLQMILGNAQLLLHEVNMMLDSRHLEGVGNKTVGSQMAQVVEPMGPQVRYEPLKGQKPAGQESLEPGAAQPVAAPQQGAGASGAAVDDSNAAEAADLAAEAMMERELEANHQFTMLMVDDSADMCRFARDYFRGEYNVLTAGDGEEALLRLEENENIDLVVSDVTMPNMDGLELCRRVKTDLRWSHIPVILLTGHTGEQMEVEGLKLGADDYITKPFNAEMLRLRVKKLIETKERRQREFKENIDVSPSEITITSVDEEFIQRAIRICEEHMADSSFSVELLGQGLDMSRTYLYRKLMSITGKGPAEFIRILRLKRAKQYLEQTHMPIADIAAAVGYSTSKRFSENFKIEFGMSPSEYVRKRRSEQRIQI